ncbi:MAG TPA: RNA polymerase sigma factor [Chitinophagaceae bacterium]
MNNSQGFIDKTDEELIDNLRQKSPFKRKGEEQLFASYTYFIREGRHKHALSEDEAFDAYSDTILSAIEKIRNGSFEGRSSLKTWLYQIFYNKCVDLLRKKTTNKRSVHQTTTINDWLLQLSDTGKTIIQKLIDKTDWDILKQKLNELGDSCKRLLTLSAEGYSDKEIGELMEYKTADVVKTSRLRCLEKLRQLYKRP